MGMRKKAEEDICGGTTNTNGHLKNQVETYAYRGFLNIYTQMKGI